MLKYLVIFFFFLWKERLGVGSERVVLPVCLVVTVCLAVSSPMMIVHAPLSIRAYVCGHVEV